MDFSYFSYITGLASLFGFIAQVMDWFPGHKDLRKSVFLVLIGGFLGSLSSVFNASSISFDFSISSFTLLIIAIGAIVLFLLLFSVFTKDTQKRNELYGISGVATVVFVFILFFGSLPNIDNEARKISNEKSQITIGELKEIAEAAIKQHNYDRAIMHFETIKSRLSNEDPRHEIITERINEIKKIQL